jgi:hypothetical protein
MEKIKSQGNRRDFLTTALPIATLACLGCKGSAAQQLSHDPKNKFSENVGMTAEETYSFFYGMFIPLFKSLSNEMGNEKLLEILTKVSSESTAQMISSMTKDLPEKNIKGFASFMKDILGTPPYNSAFTCEIVKQTDNVLELKYTECLPAKLLRSMNAIDIGHAIECSGSKAAANGFNSKIILTNLTNMMDGDLYCIERFVLNT